MNIETDAIKAQSEVAAKGALNISKMNTSGSKTNVNRVTKTIVSSPHIYKPVGPYR